MIFVVYKQLYSSINTPENYFLESLQIISVKPNQFILMVLGIVQDILFHMLKLEFELKPYGILDHGYGISYLTRIKESKSLPIFKSQLKYLILNEYRN